MKYITHKIKRILVIWLVICMVVVGPGADIQAGQQSDIQDTNAMFRFDSEELRMLAKTAAKEGVPVSIDDSEAAVFMDLLSDGEILVQLHPELGEGTIGGGDAGIRLFLKTGAEVEELMILFTHKGTESVAYTMAIGEKMTSPIPMGGIPVEETKEAESTVTPEISTPSPTLDVTSSSIPETSPEESEDGINPTEATSSQESSAQESSSSVQETEVETSPSTEETEAATQDTGEETEGETDQEQGTDGTTPEPSAPEASGSTEDVGTGNTTIHEGAVPMLGTPIIHEFEPYKAEESQRSKKGDFMGTLYPQRTSEDLVVRGFVIGMDQLGTVGDASLLVRHVYMAGEREKLIREKNIANQQSGTIINPKDYIEETGYYDYSGNDVPKSMLVAGENQVTLVYDVNAEKLTNKVRAKINKPKSKQRSRAANIGNTNQEEEGSVLATKTAAWTDPDKLEGKITLSARGVPKKTPIDVMLILDASVNMKGPAAEAVSISAMNLLQEFLPAFTYNGTSSGIGKEEAPVRVGVHLFGTGEPNYSTKHLVDQWYYEGYMGNENDLKNLIEVEYIALTTSGLFPYSLFKQPFNPVTKQILTNTNGTDQVDRDCYIIFMSNGCDNNILGNTKNAKSDILDSVKALAKENNYKNIELYTVGVALDELPQTTNSFGVNERAAATDILTDIAKVTGDGSDFREIDSKNMSQVEKISLDIYSEFKNAGTEAVIVDEIHPDYKVIEEKLSQKAQYSYNERTKREIITWNIGNLTNTIQTLDIPVALVGEHTTPNGVETGRAYETNENAILSYIDIEGQGKEQFLMSPFLEVLSNGEKQRCSIEFRFTMSDADGDFLMKDPASSEDNISYVKIPNQSDHTQKIIFGKEKVLGLATEITSQIQVGPKDLNVKFEKDGQIYTLLRPTEKVQHLGCGNNPQTHVHYLPVYSKPAQYTVVYSIKVGNDYRRETVDINSTVGYVPTLKEDFILAKVEGLSGYMIDEQASMFHPMYGNTVRADVKITLLVTLVQKNPQNTQIKITYIDKRWNKPYEEIYMVDKGTKVKDLPKHGGRQSLEDNGYQFDRWIAADMGSPKDEHENIKDRIFLAQWKNEMYATAYYYQDDTGEFYLESPINYNKETVIGSLAVLDLKTITVKDGYRIDLENKNNISKMIISSDITKNIFKVYAKKQYNVTYTKGTHGAFPEVTYSVGWGEPVPMYQGTIPTDPNKAFAGWEANPTHDGTIKTDTIFTAQWKDLPIKYVIEYYYQQDDGSYQTSADENGEGVEDLGGLVTLDLNTLQIKPNYVIDQGNKDNKTSITITDKPEDNILKVYANRQYMVTYLPGEHGTFEKEEHKVIWGDTFPIFNQGKLPTSEKYNFSGWSPKLPDATTSMTSDFTFTAQWEKKPAVNYFIEYYYQNKDGEYTNDYTKNVSSENVKDIGDRVILTLEEINQYLDLGFQLDPNHLISPITMKDNVKNVFKVYANRLQTVTYKGDSNGVVEEIHTTKWGSDIPAYGKATPTNAEYLFGGWKQIPDDVTKVTKDIVFEPQWIRKSPVVYTIEYYRQNPIDGSYQLNNKDESKVAYINTPVSVNAQTVPVPSGYAIDWLHNERVDSIIISETQPNILKVYLKLQYTVTYQPGIHGTFGTQTYTVDRGVSMPEFAGHPSGNIKYFFAGWSEDTAARITTTVMKNHTYVAQWQQKSPSSYTMEYYYQNQQGQFLLEKADSNLKGIAGEKITIDLDKVTVPNDYAVDRSNVNNVLEGTVKEDGTLVLKVFVKREPIITYSKGDRGTFVTQTYRTNWNDKTPSFYGTPTGTTGYTFTGWSPLVGERSITSVEYVAQWRKNTGGGTGGGGGGGGTTPKPENPTTPTNPTPTPGPGVPTVPETTPTPSKPVIPENPSTWPEYTPPATPVIPPVEKKPDGTVDVVVPVAPPNSDIIIKDSEDNVVYRGKTDGAGQFHGNLSNGEYTLLAINDAGTPLGQMRFTIGNEVVPLGTLPKTGEPFSGMIWYFVLLGAVWIGFYMEVGKRKRRRH